MIEKISRDEIIQVLADIGLQASQMSVADSFYVLPTEEAIQNFGKRYSTFLKNAGLKQWLEDVWDCDDFALTAKALAGIDNAIWRKATGNLDSGMAFGIIWVMTSEGGHAINFAIVRNEQGLLEARFYEPQFGTGELCLERKSRDYFVLPFWCYL